MKILFLSAANNNHTIKWVNSLKVRGADVVLVSLKNHKNLDNSINKEIKVIYLPIAGKLGYYLNYYFMNKIVKKEKPDIINVHYASGYGTLGRFIKFKNKLLNIWGSDVYNFPKSNMFNRKVLIKNLKAYKGIASTSYCMANETRKYLHPNCYIYITPFGVDVDLFKKINYCKKDNKIVLGIVKSLEYLYGIEYLIRAFKELELLLDNETFNKLELKIYGKGSLTDELMQLTQELNIQNKVKFEGYIKNNDVPMVLNQMDIFIVPSLEESFGVAALEAMACEIPVIVSDADGLKEIVQDNENGFVTAKKDSRGIAEKIKLLLENRDIYNKLSKYGRQSVIEKYELNKTVDNMFDVYKQVIEEKEGFHF